MRASKVITIILISAFLFPQIDSLPWFRSDIIILETPIEHSRSTRNIRSTAQRNTGVFTDASPIFHFLNARRAERAETSMVVPEMIKVDDIFKIKFFSNFHA